MKIAAFFACLFLFISSISLAQNLSDKDTISYCFGLIMGEELKKSGMTELDRDVLVQAMEDYLQGKETKVTAEDARNIVNKYQVEKMSKVGIEYLAENAKKSGVTTLPNGLQYEVITSGSGGPKPLLTDKVKTHYHGMLIDGTVFDSSVNRGEPISFPLNGVIKGWQEGLQLMSVGDKWRLTIPQELAYGARGAGKTIPPYATLVFEVELLGINE